MYLCTNRPNLENKDSIQGHFFFEKKRAPKNFDTSCSTSFLLGILGATSDCQTYKRSRLGTDNVEFDIKHTC